ncbi:putative reverse transcriptase domain, viral movement protein [Tanacetum coccineum]
MSNNNLFSRSSSSSFRQSSASKIDQLYEISYVLDDSIIPVSEMPLVNPYQIFTKPTNSITKRVKQFIGSAPNKQIKEFVQTSKFDSHQLPASQVEHLVSLSLPSDLPRHCLAQGYTHIHFGAIRLALTFHGRKGLPAYSRIALLDTRFVEYQHACIGTIQTTLNAGTIFVTFYPNFNIPLNDPSLLTALKAQIQIGGTPQVNTFQATFHYQMAYRVQNHSLDILVPGQDNAGDALMIDVDSNATPTCTYVPRQLSREELVKLLPEKWITNYEQIHQAPVRSTSAPEFVRHENGLVEIKFSSSQPKSDNVFPTGIHMITPTDQEPAQEVKHIWWDVCNCESCLDEAAKIDDDDEDLPKKRKSSQQKLKRRYEKGDPTVGLLGEPSGKFKQSQALSILHQDPPVFPITKGPSCSYSQEYEQEFPALTAFEHLDSRTKHDWKIKNPTTIGPTGQANTISSAEATLNWQSENAVAQNKVLVKILSQQGVSYDPKKKPLPRSYTHTTSPSLNIWASEQRRLKPSTRKEPTFSQESQSIADVVALTKTPDVLPIQKVNPVSMFLNSLTQTDKPQNTQFIAPVIKPQKDYEEFDNVESFEHLFMAEPENAESTVQFDAEDYEEHQENLNQETPTEFPKSDIKQYFTFDDVPPSKWRERSIEMLTWCTAELQYYTIDVVIKRFLTRLQGRLRDWYHSLGEYRQLQIQQGHFAGNYPDKKRSQALIQALNQVEPVDVSDLESLESDSDFGVHIINPIPHVLPIQEDPPLPLAKVHLLTDAYAKPIPVIAFFDTGSSVSILNPNILPDHYWKPHHQNFMAANGEKFVIDKISVPINIRLFPKCMIKRRLLGSSSHGKDLLIGFDILHKLPNLRWSGEGLHYRSFFNPWTAMHRLFVASITPPIFNINSIKQRLIQTCCASSHTEFLTKHPSPLWLNPSFFVSLPFKQNEDVNPTKASHAGMNPDHYQLAKEECEQLFSQGIIEPTTSPWACEAFYVNKRSEKVRGKLRLVINYQPLNHFLADDKFPLPQKKSLFQHLADARILSKFDLKSGFWQLGIKPEDRPKIAFCIPDHHYQWKNYFQSSIRWLPSMGLCYQRRRWKLGLLQSSSLAWKFPTKTQELLKFQDELSSQKMIQQFLRFVNYMADFLPKLSHHTALLFPMLKKNPPQWTSRQTEAVKAIKWIAERMPPLKISASSEKRILQTDAIDEFWGAVLLVQDNNNKRHVCGYKGGTFKASE